MDGHITHLFYTDRAGVLVSEAFTYRAYLEYLIDFLYNVTPNQRGFDMTIDHDHWNTQVPICGNPSNYNKVNLKPGEGLPYTESLVCQGHRVFRVHDRSEPSSDRICVMKDGWRENFLLGVTPEWSYWLS